MTMRSWIRKLFTRPVTRPIRKAPRRHPPGLEALEDRTVPSTFTVLNTNDTGAGSLREAVAPGERERRGRHDRLRHLGVFTTAQTITLTSGAIT